MEAFDVLEADGTNVEKKPYYERKDLLYKLLMKHTEDNTIEYVSYESDLVKAWNEAVAKNREGLIVKQKDSPYEHDRSYNWLKVKNWIFQCCNVMGYTSGKNARTPFFGALVLAKDGKFVGLAGGGFSDWELRRFKDLFSDAPRVSKPFSDAQVGESYVAVGVNVQVLVRYYKLTDAGVMRFPVFCRISIS